MEVPLAAHEASAHWARQLQLWAIPDAILQRAPESPWGFPPGLFARSAERALADPEPSPSRIRALEAVPPGGSVLDVGAGGGAASLPLAPPADLIVAVDESQAMLELFAQASERRGVGHREILGRWPEAESAAPIADVVVCHHVFYNVADLAPFVAALHRHARRRVVVELTDRHPQSDLSPLWQAIHGLARPTVPSAADAAAVATSLGYEVHIEEFERPSPQRDVPRLERIAFARRRLCVGQEHDEEIGEYLDQSADVPRRLVTLWWEHSAVE